MEIDLDLLQVDKAFTETSSVWRLQMIMGTSKVSSARNLMLTSKVRIVESWAEVMTFGSCGCLAQKMKMYSCNGLFHSKL